MKSLWLNYKEYKMKKMIILTAGLYLSSCSSMMEGMAGMNPMGAFYAVQEVEDPFKGKVVKEVNNGFPALITRGYSFDLWYYPDNGTAQIFFMTDGKDWMWANKIIVSVDGEITEYELKDSKTQVVSGQEFLCHEEGWVDISLDDVKKIANAETVAIRMDGSNAAEDVNKAMAKQIKERWAAIITERGL